MYLGVDVKRRGATTSRMRRLSGTWATLSTLLRKGQMSQMSDGRRSQVVLLDERRLDIIIQTRLYAGELLDLVASHFNIKEKEYFGIAFVDDTGQFSWLQLDKRVLEHEFPKKSASQGSALTFYFRIKYFVESITQLRDSATTEAFYLQTKSLIAKGELEIDSDIIFQLAALVLQATYGDYTDEQAFRCQLKRLPVLPTSTLKEYPSISLCENKVLEHYKELAGQTRGDAIVNYLSIVESLPTYGQHYYEIKDKTGNPCWLGLSYRGISQYDKNDRRTPRRVFLWKQLENLYFRDRKFTVEVHEARRVVHTLSSFNLYEDAIEEPVEEFDDLSNAICDPTTQVSVSRRALAPASVTVYVWYAASPNIAKCIWSMAIAQHQFFLARNHRKSHSCVIRSLSQVASELCRSVHSLSSASSLSNISRSNSSTSLPTIILEGELSEESKAATIEMLTALQSRKDALQDALKKKTEELKALCLKEGELTGELPPETPLQPGEPQPQVRRRVGTSFTLSDKFMCRAKGKDRQTLNDLELDYEIQSKIASAAFKLANDVTARKSVRKLRKVSYQQATIKLRDIEQKLCTLKREKETQKKEQDVTSKGMLNDSGLNLLGLPNSLSENSISERTLSSTLSSASVLPSTSLPHLPEGTCASAPPSPAKCRQRHQSLQHVPIITTDVYEDVSLPFQNPTRRNSSSYSAASEYDTVSCGSSSIASLGIPYRNRFEASLDIEGTNHYSVPNRRASQAFNDPDDLLLDDMSQDTLSQCCIGNEISHRYANVIPLSSSYDERLSFHKSGEFSLMRDNFSSGDCAYDKTSIDSNGIISLSCSDSNCQLSIPHELSRIDVVNHSHSENSLHRTRANTLPHKLSQMHISEPDLNLDNVENETGISHAYNIPGIRNVHRPASSGLHVHSAVPEHSSGASNHSINQVADLVQASVLLQDCKRAASSSSLEYSSPKAKTKEWVETSLDSPVLAKKRKPRQFENFSPNEHIQQVPWPENGLPSGYSAEPYFGIRAHSYNDEHCDFSTNISNSRKSPSPLPPHCSPAERTLEYRNSSPQSSYPSHSPCEQPFTNTNQCIFPDDTQYNHYENVTNVSSSSGSISAAWSNPYKMPYDGSNYSSNTFKATADVSEGHTQLDTSSNYEDFERPAVNLTIAEPQQPPRHPHRRINLTDNYDIKSVSDIDVPDFCSSRQNENSYNPDVYREASHCSIYPQAHDGSELYQYSQTPANHSESHPLKCDNFVNISSLDNQQHQNWQSFPSNISGVENVSMSSPISQSMNNLENQQQHWQHFPQNPPSIENTSISPTVPRSMNFSPNVEVNVVSVGHFQPYWEETKPYELSDFYKYSTKHRRRQKSASSEGNEIPSQHVAVDNNSDVNLHQLYGQRLTEVANNSYRDSKYLSEPAIAQNVTQPLNHHKEIVTCHIPVFDNSEQLESSAKYYEGSLLESPNLRSPGDQDKSLSLGEVGLRISLADTFHEEMVAWYQNQDSVKKATLV